MINETKQTAVEWLLDRIEDVDLTEKLWENVKQQAKEKEKQQIENAFEQGENNSVDYFNPKNRIKESEQYYIETYGGNK